MTKTDKDVKNAVIEVFTWAFLYSNGFSAPDDLQVEFYSDGIREGEVKSDTQFLAHWSLKDDDSIDIILAEEFISQHLYTFEDVLAHWLLKADGSIDILLIGV